MSLEVQLLGPPVFAVSGRPLHMNRRKMVALFAYLVATGRPESRDVLATLFWPENDQATARMNLRRDLSRLKKMLPDEVLLAGRLNLEVNRPADMTVDLVRFTAGLDVVKTHHHVAGNLCETCAQTLKELAGLYQGEFMAGFSLANSPEFDEWLFFQREHFRQETTWVLEHLVAWAGGQGLFNDGIRYGRQWLRLDPWNEPAHRALMKLYAWSDQLPAAQRQYEECARLLNEELGLEPEAETDALNAAIMSRQLPAATASTRERMPPAAAVETPADQEETTPGQPALPVAATPLIGRQQEKSALSNLLTRPENRVVTITGAGGMGKTRLALALATAFQADGHRDGESHHDGESHRDGESHQDGKSHPDGESHHDGEGHRDGESHQDGDHFADGVYFVELAALESADFILPTLAQAMGLRLERGNRQLIAYLRDKSVLVVLDNFEHLLDGAALVDELLKQCPQLTFLVTSRERLHLQGEHIYPLGGLEIPDQENPEAAAGELFLTSARRVRPGFTPTAAEWAAIIEICALVEGMPLALELAGSWSDVLSPAEIAAEIRDSLDFLETELVNVPGRHRSVRAAISGSWVKLTAEQQQQLARLSVLRGSFTRPAAQTIAGVSLRSLTNLINKSFIGFNQQTGRYDIHALILKFAGEQLSRDPAGKAQTAAAHAHYFSELLGEWRWFTPYQEIEATLDQVDLEIDNIRVMWQWAVVHEDVQRVYRGFTTLGRYFLNRGSLPEGIALLQSAADMLAGREGEAVLRGRIKAVLASMHQWQGNFEETISMACEAIEIGRAEDAPDVLALALFEWGYALWRRSEYEASREKLTEAMVTARRANIKYLEADALRTLGLIQFVQGDLENADQMLTGALALFRKCGEIQGEALTLNNMGMVESERKQMRLSADLFKQSMALHRQVKDRSGEARALTNLSNVESELGHIVPAIEHAKQALAMHRKAGLRLGEAVNLGWLGKMYTDLGQFELAREHLYQGVALCAELGAKQDEINMLVKACRLEIQTAEFERAYQTGRKTLMMTQEFEVTRQTPAAMNCCGHALFGLGDSVAAREAFQDALRLLAGDDQAKSRTEPQAGLARIAHQEGEIKLALNYVEPILEVITGRPLTGIFDAFGIYLTCYEVLQAAGDERAGKVLETAIKRLEAQAQQIYDYQLRASFLRKVPAHQALRAAYQRL